MIATFIQQYGMTILYTLITALAGFIGVQIKRIYEKHIADEEKRKAVETCVKAVEQLYKDLHGEEKKQKAIEGITQMLENKGITISNLEIEMLLEAAVAEFNAQRTARKDTTEGGVTLESEIRTMTTE